MHKSGELPVPLAAQSDERAIELARIWAAGGGQHVSLATGLWNDPANWGIMLVDLARHVATAYQQSQDRDPDEVLNRIKEGFDAEWGATTDHPQGGLLE
jgi:hypothetical protein